MFEKDAASLRQLHPPRRSQKETRAELIFETSNLAADRGLSNSQRFRRSAYIAHLGYGHEVFDLRETHTAKVAKMSRRRRAKEDQDQNGIGLPPGEARRWSSKMTKIVLRYFPLIGRVQPLRAALADAGVTFEDVRVTDADWGAKREVSDFAGPYAGLPTLSWGDVTISETLAISTFLAKRLGEYEGLDDAQIAVREAVCSNCYLEVLVRIGELIWCDLMYPGVELAKTFNILAPRIVGKLEGVNRQYRGDWLGGAKPGMADFFAAESLDVLRSALGTGRDAALRARMPRLFELASRLAERPSLAATRANRPRAFTARPDEEAALARLRAIDLTSMGL